MALTDWTTVPGLMVAEKTPEAAWNVLAAAVQNDVAQIKADAATQATVESDCDALALALSSAQEALFKALFAGEKQVQRWS